MVNYDGRGIGVGLGVNAGVLGYENKEPRDDAKNYNPDEVVRKTAVLMRLRLFSERNLFLENITEFDPLVFNISTNNNNGYDNTAERKSKAYKSKFMLGSRFNTDKYMLKIGFINSSMYTSSFLVEGQVYIAPGCYLYPQLMLGGSKSNYNQRYSAGLTFEYRYYNNKVRAPRR
jgi:hypothetical protein